MKGWFVNKQIWMINRRDGDRRRAIVSLVEVSISHQTVYLFLSGRYVFEYGINSNVKVNRYVLAKTKTL